MTDKEIEFLIEKTAQKAASESIEKAKLEWAKDILIAVNNHSLNCDGRNTSIKVIVGACAVGAVLGSVLIPIMQWLTRLL